MIGIASCGDKVDPNSTGTGGVCSIATIVDGSGDAENYSYNSDLKVGKVNLTSKSSNTTYDLSYDNIQKNGPVVVIGNKTNKSLTILDYSNDNLMKTVLTTIPEKDGGIILGKPVTITDFRNDITFEWNSNKQLIRQNVKYAYNVKTNGNSSPVTSSVYLTYVYNASGELIRMNNYSNETISIGSNVITSPNKLMAYSTYEYEANISEPIINTGPTGLEISFLDDGQLIFSPKSKKAIKKTNSFLDDAKGGFTQSVSNYTNTTNASGFLIKTVAVYQNSTETFTYSYNNCN